jgi:hypothetical protein
MRYQHMQPVTAASISGCKVIFPFFTEEGKDARYMQANGVKDAAA